MRSSSRASWRLSAVALCAALLALSARGPDWGTRWQFIGPSGGSIRALAFDRLDPRIIFAGTSNGGVFRSLNGAHTWRPANAGMAGTTVVDLAVGPLTPSRLHAATAAAGVFRSTNRGLSWQACNSGLDTLALRAIAIDPANAATLLVASFGGGIFRSDDGCERWRPYSEGLDDAFVLALATDAGLHARPASFYAGTQSGLFRMQPGNERWVRISPLPWYVQDVLVDPATGAIHLAAPGDGVFVSRDDGRSWTDANTGLADLMVTGLALAHDGTLYARTESGALFASSDGALSWHAIAAWPQSTRIETLAVDARAPARVFAGTDFAGVSMSRNAGQAWKEVNRGLHNLEVEVLVVAPAEEGEPGPVLLAGSRYAGVFRSLDGGRVWQPGRGVTDPHVTAIARGPQARSRVYLAAGNGQVLVSNDRGASWTAPGAGTALGSTIDALAVHPLAEGTLLGGGSSGILFGTQDGGRNWEPLADFPGARIRQIVFDPTDPATVYVATHQGIYKRGPGDMAWRPANTGLRDLDIQALAVDPNRQGTVYAASYGSGVYRSTDGAAHWQPVNAGLADHHVRTIVLDPTDSTRLYAAGRIGRIFRSNDSGNRWQMLDAHPDLAPINVLAIDPLSPRRLFAATSGNSVVVTAPAKAWAWIDGVRRITRPPPLVPTVAADAALATHGLHQSHLD